MQKWNLIKLLKQKIAEKGGPVCCHAHFDKAYVVTPETLEMTLEHMEALGIVHHHPESYLGLLPSAGFVVIE